MKFFLAIFFICQFNLVFADSNVGIIVKKKGDVVHLTNPSQKFTNQKNTILYEGLYYVQQKAKLGSKISNGDILKTGKEAKARIVYKNGDQLNIAEGSAFKISWKKDPQTQKPASTIEILNGAIRGIVSKKGPRNSLRVKSRSAVMGVRGTDFHFSQKGTSGQTSISVLRGKVEVAKQEKPKEIMKVSQGFSAKIEPKEKTQIPTKVDIVQTTKNDLIEIQKETKILKPDMASKEVEKDLIQLEKEAIKTTLEDIKEYQPEVYKVLEKKKITEVDTVNTVVVTKALEKAPIKKTKKGFEELGIDLNQDAYKKYFKIEDAL